MIAQFCYIDIMSYYIITEILVIIWSLARECSHPLGCNVYYRKRSTVHYHVKIIQIRTNVDKIVCAKTMRSLLAFGNKFSNNPGAQVSSLSYVYVKN